MADELGIFTGQAIVKRICDEVKDLVPDEGEDRREWFKRADHTIQLSNEMVDGFELLRAASLAVVEDEWDTIPLDVRAEYGYQFRVYAEKRCPALQWTTIDNHIRAARTFILEGVKPAGKIEIIKRNPDKTPVLKDGLIETEFVEFDPLNVSMSKLIVARSAADKGKIDNNPVIWAMLADDGIPLHELRSELFSDASKRAGINPEITFELQGPVLIVHQGLDEAVLIDDDGFKWEAYYNPADKNHELVKIGLNRIFLLLSIRPDEEIMSAMLSKRMSDRERRESRRIRSGNNSDNENNQT